MIKNKLSLKNWLYLAVFLLSTAFFVALRCFYLCFLTNLETGMCYEFRTFDFYFILISVLFLAFSFVFFRFVNKPIIKNFHNVNRSKVLGFISFMVSIAMFVGSFSMLFRTNVKNAATAPFNFLFFLTGTFFSISLIFLSVCLIFGLDYHNLSLILVFCSAFLWAVLRFVNLIFTSLFQDYDLVEYRFIVLGLVFLFAFFYYFGRLILNYNSVNSGSYFLTFGFLYILIAFANVAPKLFLNFSSWLNLSESSEHLSSFFKVNINLLNFHNFNLVDFAISLFVFSLILVFMASNNKNKPR